MWSHISLSLISFFNNEPVGDARLKMTGSGPT